MSAEQRKHTPNCTGVSGRLSCPVPHSAVLNSTTEPFGTESSTFSTAKKITMKSTAILLVVLYGCETWSLNPLTPNDHYSGRTASLTSKRCVLYIYSTNIGTLYFKHGIYSPFFPIQNAVCFIILTYLVPVLFTFYIQVC